MTRPKVQPAFKPHLQDLQVHLPNLSKTLASALSISNTKLLVLNGSNLVKTAYQVAKTQGNDASQMKLQADVLRDDLKKVEASKGKLLAEHVLWWVGELLKVIPEDVKVMVILDGITDRGTSQRNWEKALDFVQRPKLKDNSGSVNWFFFKGMSADLRAGVKLSQMSKRENNKLREDLLQFKGSLLGQRKCVDCFDALEEKFKSETSTTTSSSSSRPSFIRLNFDQANVGATEDESEIKAQNKEILKGFQTSRVTFVQAAVSGKHAFNFAIGGLLEASSQETNESIDPVLSAKEIAVMTTDPDLIYHPIHAHWLIHLNHIPGFREDSQSVNSNIEESLSTGSVTMFNIPELLQTSNLNQQAWQLMLAIVEKDKRRTTKVRAVLNLASKMLDLEESPGSNCNKEDKETLDSLKSARQSVLEMEFDGDSKLIQDQIELENVNSSEKLLTTALALIHLGKAQLPTLGVPAIRATRKAAEKINTGKEVLVGEERPTVHVVGRDDGPLSFQPRNRRERQEREALERSLQMFASFDRMMQTGTLYPSGVLGGTEEERAQQEAYRRNRQ